jgi:hypothetical protein
MIILFIIVGGFVLQCTLNQAVATSSCMIADYRAFGALAGAGVLELIFEFKGLLAIFQRKNKDD